LDSNRYYQPFSAPGVSGYVVTDLGVESLESLLGDPDEPFRRPGVHLLKDSRGSTVVGFDLVVNGRVRRVIYKRFRLKAGHDPLVSLCHPTPALRSWIYGHGLRERCLPSPRPLAMFHRRRQGLYHEGYLLTEKVADAVDLQRFLDKLDALTEPVRRDT